jgi:UDPglucose--hexose-1-phosphate uridylyltransferase
MHRPRAVPRSALLADGRSIHYFDDQPGTSGDPPPDRRTLAPEGSSAELRHDALLDEWVVVATHRQKRTHLPAARDCPLCPSSQDTLTEIPASAYDVVVFQNRFPSLPAAAPGEPPRGSCEVICYSSDHDVTFAGLDVVRLRTIADALLSRSEALATEPGVAYVLPFENRGEEIGVTLHHPHGQIYAYPYVPARVARLAASVAAHRQRTGACLGCDLVSDELADGRRVVVAGRHAVAYVPFAARWPFELHVVPRRHATSLSELTGEELDELVALQADALFRLDSVFGGVVPYMAGWLGAPVAEGSEPLHLRLEIVSPRRDAAKIKHLAGSETLAGAFINDVRPEEAAERLRRAPGRASR